MSTKSPRREQLLEAFQSKAYRDAFVADQIATGLSFQVRANREARRWSQTELGERAGGMLQPAISRLEGPDHEAFPKLDTLARLASAFDLALIVRLVPFSELLDWTAGLPSRDLAVPSFHDDTKLATATRQKAALPTKTTADAVAQILNPPAQSVSHHIGLASTVSVAATKRAM